MEPEHYSADSDRNLNNKIGPSVTTVSRNDEIKFDGTVHLTQDNTTILIPSPSRDPRDPLNLSQKRKIVIVCILTLYAVSGLCMVTALGALIVYMIPDYKRAGVTDGQISWLLTYPSLFLGLGNLISMPLALAIGRRPVMLLSTVLLFLAGILSATNKNFDWHLGARCLAAFSAAQCQALVLLIIQDITFIHQRARFFQYYASAEVLFNSSLVIASSYMADAAGWRSWYWMFSGLSGLACILAFIFVPETYYERPIEAYKGTVADDNAALVQLDSDHYGRTLTVQDEIVLDLENYEPRTWASDMQIFAMRPNWTRAISNLKNICEVFLFPHVFFIAISCAAFQGFDVSIQITYGSTLVKPPYNWANTSVSLIQLGQLPVSLLSLPLIGSATDWIIQKMARRNKGIHEPEYRLIALVFPWVLTLILTVIYGFAIEHPQKFHWFAIVFVVNGYLFILMATSTVGAAYLIDAHPRRAGSILVVIPVVRGLVSFGLSKHTTDYIASIGAAATFGIYAGFTGLLGIIGLLVFWKGKLSRQMCMRWAR